jgi:TRAP-type C4-dicarboxylate transport system substrate-binding protein
MARKEDNLVKGDEAHKLTAEEQSMGGKASAEARRKKRDLREALEILLDKEYTDKKTGETMQGIEVVTAALFKEAAKGNVKAFNTLRDTIGQQVVQKVMIAEVDADVIAEVEAIVEQSE